MRRVLPIAIVALAAACGVDPGLMQVADPHGATDQPASSVDDTARVPISDHLAADETPIGEAVVIEGDVATPEPPPVEDVIDAGPGPIVAFSYQIDDAAGADFLTRLNDERRAASLAPLKVYWDLEDDAHLHTERMIDAGEIYHNPNLADVTGPVWSRIGENVGVGGNVEMLHRAFMNSPGHRANVLGDFTHVGIGAQRGPTSRLWVTFVFMKTTVPNIDRTHGPFVDDDFTTHEVGISKIAEAGITVGCDSTGRRYCPNDPVTRGQMATFLTRAFGLPSSTTNYFVDDDGAWYEQNANALAQSGITMGCNTSGTRFCGAENVTRGQMAAFLTRALSLPPASGNYFDDDDGSFYEESANRMYEAGVTRGCGDRNYCGAANVTRAEMATFLTRALGL